MKNSPGIGITLIVAAGILITVGSVAQDATKSMEMMKHGQPVMPDVLCPLCSMMNESEVTPEMLQAREELLTEAGITTDMMDATKAMLAAPMSPASPGILLGTKTLQLTDDQKSRLQEIEKKGAVAAMAVLTEEQRAMLRDVSGEATTLMARMRAMHRKLLPVIRQRVQDGQATPVMCPMMATMLGHEAPQDGAMNEGMKREKPRRQ